jgi:hypothetical protein
MFGIVLSLTPTMARVAFLSLLQQKHAAGVLRLLLKYAPLLTPVSTVLPATLVCQLFAPNDMVSSFLFLAFWCVPPLIMFVYRAFVERYYPHTTVTSLATSQYLLFLSSYVGLLMAMVFRIVAVNNWEQYLSQAVNDPSTWLELISSILLTNVAVSDLLGHLTETRYPDVLEVAREYSKNVSLGGFTPSETMEMEMPLVDDRGVLIYQGHADEEAGGSGYGARSGLLHGDEKEQMDSRRQWSMSTSASEYQPPSAMAAASR